MSSAHMSSGIALWRGKPACFEFPCGVLQGAHLELVSLCVRVSLPGEVFIWLLHVPGCCHVSDSPGGIKPYCQAPTLDVPWRWSKPPHNLAKGGYLCLEPSGWAPFDQEFTSGGPHLKNEDTEIERGQVICPRHRASELPIDVEFEHQFSDSRVYFFLYTALHCLLPAVPKHQIT